MEKYLATAKKTLRTEAQAVSDQVKHIDGNFSEALRLISECTGRLVVMGLGKSGLVGRKIAATMSSVGIPAVFLHPAECLHGDIGMIMNEDIVLVLSYTGETDEIKKVLPVVKKMGIKILVITGKPKAAVWLQSDVIINSSIRREACPYNLAPTSSTTAMLALGDALALAVSEKKGFRKESLARFHPSGGIGKKLTVKVRDIMKKGKNNPVIGENASVGSALVVMTSTRLGAANIVDRSGKFAGFFTDGDLRRKLLEDKNLLKRKLKDVMTKQPLTIGPDTLAVDAAKILKKHSFDNIPVINDKGKPIGILDERDLLAAGIV